MGNAILVIGALLGLVPQEHIATARCGLLQLNHVCTVRELPWNQGFEVNERAYWLGWREIVKDGDELVVDWWRCYRGQHVYRNHDRCYLFLRDGQTGRPVRVIAKRFEHYWSQYDIEREQQRRYKEKWGFDHKLYRRGLAGAKPQ